MILHCTLAESGRTRTQHARSWASGGRFLVALLTAAALCSGWGSGPALAQLGARIVGGVPAPEGELQFQACLSIGRQDGICSCGGTLVSADWVITAAHCVVSPRTGAVAAPDAIRIRLGSVYRDQKGTVVGARQVIAHERYNRSTLENDIALVRLTSPVSLPAVTLEPGTGIPQRVLQVTASPWATVAGWGDMVGSQSVVKVAQALQKAEVPIVDNATCNASMAYLAGPIDDRRICAGLSEGGVDSCNGDSGGPLLLRLDGTRWVQVGIVSYGHEECGKPGHYGVYTRVAAFQPWIARAMGQTNQADAVAVRPPAPAPVTPGALGAAPTIVKEAGKNNLAIRIAMSKRDLRLGDSFDLTISSPIGGQLLLFDMTANNDLILIFPNPRSKVSNKSGLIRANAPLRIPDATYGFELVASEPRGRGRLLAVVASDLEAFLDAQVRADMAPQSDPAATMRSLDGLLARLGAPIGDGGARGAQGQGGEWALGFADYEVR